MRLSVGGAHGSLGTLLVGARRDGRPYDAQSIVELQDLATLVAAAKAGDPERAAVDPATFVPGGRAT